MDLFEKAQLQLQRHAEGARKMYQPASRRYLLRTVVKWGECGLGMNAAHQRSICKKYEYLYYQCKGQSPLTCGRSTKCASRRVRADRLDAVVWNSPCELLHTPTLLPQLHQSWTQSKQHDLTALTAQHEHLRQRKRRVERQSDRLLEAYQTEIITLSELQLRRQKLTTELHHLDRELQQLTQSQQQTLHWHDVIAHIDHFRQLLGENLDRLPFADRQTVAQCLIKKVVVTGEHVDISYLLPFDQPPQVYNSNDSSPEGTPGHFYRLRLADLTADKLLVSARSAKVIRVMMSGKKLTDSDRGAAHRGQCGCQSRHTLCALHAGINECSLPITPQQIHIDDARSHRQRQIDLINLGSDFTNLGFHVKKRMGILHRRSYSN